MKYEGAAGQLDSAISKDEEDQEREVVVVSGQYVHLAFSEVVRVCTWVLTVNGRVQPP